MQPPPHEHTKAEQARLERALNSADPADSIEAQKAREGDVLA